MRKHIAAIIASALALSVTHTVIAQHSHREHQTRSQATSGTASEQEKMQKYTCPMHPEVITDHPGNCPKCGMKLVPIKEKKRRTSNVQALNIEALDGDLTPNRPQPRARSPAFGRRGDPRRGRRALSTKKCRWKCTPPSISLIR